MREQRTENREQIHTKCRAGCSLFTVHCRARGFTLIELLVYTGILVIIMAVAVSTLLSLSRSVRTVSSAQLVESAAEVSLDRMMREARGAQSIDMAESSLGVSPGQLTLDTTDAGGASTTVEFFLSGQTLRIKEAGADVGPLTPTSTRVTALSFRKIQTANSQAVKIEMTVESGTSTSYRSKNFYGTAVLRGSYVQ